MRIVGLVSVACLVLAGCAIPPAQMELLTVARQGLAHARQAELERLSEQEAQFNEQASALDAAFDADVRLVAAGRLQSSQDQPIELTEQWVISARQGYAAAIRLLHARQQQAMQAHLVRLDNLQAADEALEMAQDLLLQQASLSEQTRQYLANLHRRWIHEQ